ncbi:TIR domain-containing protein [Psychrobacter immobilis]|uniref:TIR domain-containing protein n=1 Tax=Psychrobacter immobilis TaxID=498 RepID=UPI001917C430|nr:TIR domain-containing protein [Psychrobacter immobilis]
MGSQNNVFISHYGKDDYNVQSLKKRLKNAGYDIRNSSIDSTKHHNRKPPSNAVVERLLRARIHWAGTFICLIGEKTHTRPWVDYEIKQAHLKGKQIIGIYKHGCTNNVKLPDNFKKYGGSILGSNSLEKLGDVISGKTALLEKPDGTESDSIHTIKRVSCS